jgi:glycosyltransferase 2 family protein
MTGVKVDPSRVRKWLLFLAKLAVFALLLWFVRDTFAKALDQISRQPWRFSPLWLVLAATLYATSLVPSGWFWFRTLRALGQEVRPRDALRAFGVATLGKYVPGKAMVVILRTAMVCGHRVQIGVVAASVFVETLTMMAVGAFLAAGLLLWKLSDGSLRLDDRLNPPVLVCSAFLMTMVVGLPTFPPVFRRLAGLARVGRSDPTVTEKLRGLGFGTLGMGWGAAIVSWSLLGGSLWATFRAIGVEGPSLMPGLANYVAAMALATVAGFLAMLPAGLGVRDIVLVGSLVMLLGVEEGQALLAAGLLRIVWLVAEVAIAGTLYWGVKRA